MPSERVMTPVPSSWPCGAVTVIDTVLGCTAWAIAATPVADRLDAGLSAVGLAYVVPPPITAATAPSARLPPRISARARPPAAALRLVVHHGWPPGGPYAGPGP